MVNIQFGSPIALPPVRRATRESDLQRNTDEIMCQIAAMLPPAYRGVYNDHPRLLELTSPIPASEAVPAAQAEAGPGR